MVSTTSSSDESTPASTTASIHSGSSPSASSSSSSHFPTSLASDELHAPSTDSTNLYIIDELNRAVPGLEVHNSLEDSFLPPPTAASLVGSPPGLQDPADPESKTLSPGFKVHPRGHSAPVIISRVCLSCLVDDHWLLLLLFVF